MTIAQLDRSSQVNDPSSSDKRLRILFLVPFAPGLRASHGGGRVIGQLIAHLAQRHQIALCYVRASGEPAIDDTLRKHCDVVEEVLLLQMKDSATNPWSRRLRVWRELMKGKPLWAIDRFHPEVEERVKSLINSWHPDIVQIEFHIMGQYLSALEGYPAPRILVQHEAGVESAREAMRSPLSAGRIMSWLDLLAWQRFERKVLQQVQTVVVFTERDHESVSRLSADIPVMRIPFGTEIPERAPDASEEPLSLLFVGNFKHLPNLDAADRLINRIFPQVQDQIPEARLYLVGDHLRSTFMNRADKNVICTGYVPDVKPYLDKASIVVVPVRLGGGMRVKILEALSAGKAIVASSLAVEGLGLVNGEQVILAEENEEFSRAIIDLLRSPHQRASFASRTRVWAGENLSWEKTVLAYDDLYHQLLREHNSPRFSD